MKLPFACGNCGHGMAMAEPVHVFDGFNAGNVMRLFRHFALHYRDMLAESRAHEAAVDAWQNEGGP